MCFDGVFSFDIIMNSKLRWHNKNQKLWAEALCDALQNT